MDRDQLIDRILELAPEVPGVPRLARNQLKSLDIAELTSQCESLEGLAKATAAFVPFKSLKVGSDRTRLADLRSERGAILQRMNTLLDSVENVPREKAPESVRRAKPGVMTKRQLIEATARQNGTTLAHVSRTLDSLLDVVKEALLNGDTVQLIGFGNFGVGRRAARTGRNPSTGQDIEVPAAKTVKFTAGKAFKDKVNKR